MAHAILPAPHRSTVSTHQHTRPARPQKHSRRKIDGAVCKIRTKSYKPVLHRYPARISLYYLLAQFGREMTDPETKQQQSAADGDMCEFLTSSTGTRPSADELAS